MFRGIYASALGMTTQMKNMDVLSNNIANVDTTGFKRDISVTQTFSEELMKRLDDPVETNLFPFFNKHDTGIGDTSFGVFVNSVHTDFSSGRFVLTAGTFDMAIDGSGFFAVNTLDAQGNTVEKYTRDGAFTLNQDRYLVTKEGNYAMGQNGNIYIPDGECNITVDGEIYVNREYIDTIRIVGFDNLESLRKTGDNLYTTTEESQQAQGFAGSVMQGYLEGSNINSVNEMVRMITVSRVYEANQKMLVAQDTMLGRAVSDIGRK